MNTRVIISQPTTIPGSPLVQISSTLLGIIVSVLAVAQAIKRLGFAPKSTGTCGLKVTASTSLNSHERVVIIEIEDARSVSGVTASQISVLHALPPAPADIKEKAIFPTDLQAMMKSLLRRPRRS